VSTAELLTVIFGLLLGYGIISRWLSRRGSQSRDVVTGEDAIGSDDLHREWVRAHCHEILGVSPDAPFEAIYSAYRSKVQQYHPDRTEGLGPELRSLAARKIEELNAAYAWAMRSHSGA
jgi:DnaJ-domain-containing protein 1